MARKVIWSSSAQENRREIFIYWNHHNNSNVYSRKLNYLFNEAINLLKTHPFIGRKTNIDFVYIKIVRQFLIIYEIKEAELIILNIWDARRNPSKMP